MKKRSFGYERKNAAGGSGFLIKSAVCAALFLTAVLVKNFGDEGFYDALLYSLGQGPELDEVVEAFGRAPADREAFAYIWESAVAEPVGRLFDSK